MKTSLHFACCALALVGLLGCSASVSTSHDDAGASDASSADAGALDAGAPRDAGSDDAGVTQDSGIPADAGVAFACSKSTCPSLLDLWNHTAHFVVDQEAAPIPGHIGHREAFAVFRPDISPTTLYLYHRDWGTGTPEIYLSISNDSGRTFATPAVKVVPQTLGHFAVAPTVAKVGTTWTMVYEEGGAPEGTHWATSTDGVTWQRRGALISDGAYHATPGLYVHDSNVYVFSATFVGAGTLGIVVHGGPDMAHLAPLNASAFVLRPSASTEASISMPRVFFDQGFHWMIYEAGTVNLNCGDTSAEQNMMGWGIARSTNLIAWEKYPFNPIAQGVDAQSCGIDMPQPVKDPSTGAIYVYHPSDSTIVVQRERLEWGQACSSSNSFPNWREKNHACLPSCGGIGGTACYQTKDCTTGTRVGQSWDCTACCK